MVCRSRRKRTLDGRWWYTRANASSTAARKKLIWRCVPAQVKHPKLQNTLPNSDARTQRMSMEYPEVAETVGDAG